MSINITIKNISILLVIILSLHILYTKTMSPKQHALLTTLYDNKLGKLLRNVITRPFFSKFLGFLCDLQLSKYAIPYFVRTYNIDISQVEFPLSSYKTFNEFFIRKLKSTARPIKYAENTVISPADGTILILQNLNLETQFPIKNLTFNLEKFLNNKQLAQEYIGGTLLLFRLEPWDYHRFHLPCSGLVHQAHSIHGRYESVNPIAYKAGVQVLTENERHIITIDSPVFERIIMVPVGALCVGRINYSYQPNQYYVQGDELGYFAFGGSTIAMLFKKEMLILDDMLLSCNLNELPIMMGKTIGKKKF